MYLYGLLVTRPDRKDGMKENKKTEGLYVTDEGL
jgi:hypothetical protein